MSIYNTNKLVPITINGRSHIHIYNRFNEPCEAGNFYLDHILSKGYRSNTIRSHALSLSQYIGYCDINGLDYADLEDFKSQFEEILQNYTIYLERPSKRKRSRKTIIKIIKRLLWFKRYSILRLGDKKLLMYIDYLIEEYNKLDESPYEEVSFRYYKRITDEEFALLLKECNNLRDKIILKLLHDVGLRSGELLTLRWEDLRPSENLIVVNGVPNLDTKAFAKTGYRMAAASNGLFDMLKQYKEELKNNNRLICEYVFVSRVNTPKPIKYAAIRSLLRSLSDKTGIDLHAHAFRKTCAQNMFLRGVSRKAIGDQLGHKDPKTTEGYYIGFLWDALASEVLAGVEEFIDGAGI